MDLSVVILTFNQRDTTLRCLASVCDALEQLRRVPNPIEGEIILVDNGSSDGTGEEVEALTARLDCDIPLHYIPLPTNIGVAPGRNRGIEAAAGRFIMLLDNDTLVNPRAIARLVGHLVSTPLCGIAAPRLNYPDGTIQENCKAYPGLGVKLRNLLRRSGAKAHPEIHAGGISHPCYVMGACQIFPRSLIYSIGPLDGAIFYGPEDADFCLRASAAGFTIDWLPDVAIIHDHRHVTRTSPFSPIARRHIRALLHFWWKHRRLF